MRLCIIFAVASSLVANGEGFSPYLNRLRSPTASARHADADSDADADVDVPVPAEVAPRRGSQQPLYGTVLEIPDTYVRCGNCQTIYALKEEDLGGGKGRRLECTVCNHSWFQSKDRMLSMKDGFELVARPPYEIDRIMLNMRENKPPNFVGDQKLYVGNVAFECVEQDLYEAFSQYGSVGDVSLVRDDFGKNRGFGFITMRTNEEGERAIAELDGKEIKGRTIAVRPSNT